MPGTPKTTKAQAFVYVSQDYAYQFILHFFLGFNRRRLDDSGSQRPGEDGTGLISWDAPNGVTLLLGNTGLMEIQSSVKLVGLASRVVHVTWEWSAHPLTRLGWVLSRLPSLSAEVHDSPRRSMLRLKHEMESGSIGPEVLTGYVAPDPLATLYTRTRFETPADRIVWHHALTLFEGASLFAMMGEAFPEHAETMTQMYNLLRQLGEYYLALSPENDATAARHDLIIETYKNNLVRLALSSRRRDQQLLVGMQAYFTARAKYMIDNTHPRQFDRVAAGRRAALTELLARHVEPDTKVLTDMWRQVPDGSYEPGLRAWAERRMAARTAQAPR